MGARTAAVWLAALASAAHGGEVTSIGLAQGGARIDAITEPAPSDVPTVLIVGGLSGVDASVAAVRDAIADFEQRGRHDVRLIAIPLANPQGVRLEFPPTGTAYRDHPESHVLWRWVGLHAPDLVLIAGRDEFGLARALSHEAVAEVGPIPARVGLSRDALSPARIGHLAPSAAHVELERRRARSPLALAHELAMYYGHDFSAPLYIQAIALIGQLRLGHLDEVRQLAEPYVNGTRDSLERPNSLVLGGHILFSELARRTGDPRYLARVRAAADLGFDANGNMKESMPYHGGFSDSIFMGTAIVAQAGALTGERKYFDLAVRHVDFMRQLVLRPDGLYRHHPPTDAAWGRANAFPALGLTLLLSELPPSHPDYPRMLKDYRDLMAALLPYQDADGMWHNVIDYPGAYAEFSATAMIAFAMLRGTERGWLTDASYSRAVQRAWRGVLERVGPEGHLVDVCESTATATSLDEYLHRAAILGPDPRGGAMALLLATELAGLR
jgi:rhamnogalacturonyl hydrolase YesR